MFGLEELLEYGRQQKEDELCERQDIWTILSNL